jgi:beta-lactamase superfamily II metal-dependent hydrolase
VAGAATSDATIATSPAAVAKAPKTKTPAPAPVAERSAMGNLGAAPKTRARSSAIARDAAFVSIEMLPAGHGDCLWIEYGDGARTHRVLMDCGTAGTYKDFLKARIERLPQNEREFDLLILSHIDDDHIGGGIPLLKDAKSLGVTIGDVWFNGWRHLAPFAALGAKQGEMFSELILQNVEQKRLKWNAWQDGKSIVLPDEGPLPACVLPGGMKLTLLSPSRDKLADLAPAWKKAVEKEGMVPGDRDDARELLGGARETDSTDVQALADAEFTPDAAENNGSSIAVLAEYEGKRVLLAADAHAPLLVDSIRRLLRKEERKLTLDAFKLPHHGSQNNLNTALVQLLDCKHYLVSSNGDRFKHPDRQAIGRVIHYGGERPRLCFNYESTYNEVWKDAGLQRKYNYEASYPTDDDAGLIVRL